MYQFTQVQYIKRKNYSDVIIYYSRNGDKFRPETGVKVLNKHLTISSSHPNHDEDLKKIKDVQDRVENLVITYKDRYGDKPPVQWLEKEFGKPQLDSMSTKIKFFIKVMLSKYLKRWSAHCTKLNSRLTLNDC